MTVSQGFDRFNRGYGSADCGVVGDFIHKAARRSEKLSAIA